MIKSTSLFVFICLSLISCNNASNKSDNTPLKDVAFAKVETSAQYSHASLTIEGMTCAVGCATTIQKNLSKMEGIKSAKVDFDSSLATIEYDAAKIQLQDIKNKITSLSKKYSVSLLSADSLDQEAFKAQTCAKDCKKQCCSKN
jgi:Cu+-exporting ATPase